MYVCVYVCLYVCLYVCTCVCMYVCVCVYILRYLEHCAVPNKKLFGLMVRHMSFLKTLTCIYKYLTKLVIPVQESGFSIQV